MLTGRPVVDEDNTYRCILMHGNGELRIPESLLDSPLGPVVLRAVVTDHTARFADAGEFRDALESVDPDCVPTDLALPLGRRSTLADSAGSAPPDTGQSAVPVSGPSRPPTEFGAPPTPSSRETVATETTPVSGSIAPTVTPAPGAAVAEIGATITVDFAAASPHEPGDHGTAVVRGAALRAEIESASGSAGVVEANDGLRPARPPLWPVIAVGAAVVGLALVAVAAAGLFVVTAENQPVASAIADGSSGTSPAQQPDRTAAPTTAAPTTAAPTTAAPTTAAPTTAAPTVKAPEAAPAAAMEQGPDHDDPKDDATAAPSPKDVAAAVPVRVLVKVTPHDAELRDDSGALGKGSTVLIFASPDAPARSIVARRRGYKSKRLSIAPSGGSVRVRLERSRRKAGGKSDLEFFD